MTAPKILAAALETFLALLLLGLLHRSLTFSALAGNLEVFSEEGARALLVGTFSDWWIAYLGAIAVALAMGMLVVAGWPNGARLLQVCFLGLFAWAAALHVSYVHYFHFQIIPFHLRYLNDLAFIKANSRSLLNASVAASLLAAPLVWLWLMWADLFNTWRMRRLFMAHALLLVTSLAAHNRNIHTRVQWFIPENLQVNALERLYMHLKTARIPVPIKAQERAELALGLSARIARTTQDRELLDLITKPVGAPVGRIGEALRGKWLHSVKAKTRPLLIIVLMESLRPAETGYFAPESGPSLTPVLDQLAATGLTFMRAYATGSVTRGAQEATFCGYLGSRDTSLMRGEASASFSCLPDLIRRGLGPNKGETFWLHGGDGRFDGQVEFWRAQGVGSFLSLKDFPSQTARSGWGIGDKSFFQAAATKLKHLHDDSAAEFLLGMVLSVTNHVPWDLPFDAGPEVQAQRAAGHPSYRTTAYSDAALGEFITGLKTQGLWEHTLMIVSSDHGTNLPPLADLYLGQKNREQLLASHINLLISGGLTRQALDSIGASHLRLDKIVSQVGIAATIGAILPLPSARFMGDDLLAEDHTMPVLSDLEQDLIDHQDDRVYSHQDLVSKDAESLPMAERKTLLYYRAFLEYIYSPPTRF